MKTSYLIKDFQKTVAQRFPAKSELLNTAFFKRLTILCRENAGSSKEKQRHLERQILPGIAIYETLQIVISKEEALQIIHGYVEQHARKMKKVFLALMRVPGLYRKVPKIFAEQTPKHFGAAAGFATREIYRFRMAFGELTCSNAPITIPVFNTTVRSYAAVSATATILLTMACIQSLTGIEQKRSDAAMRYVIFV